MGTWLLSTSKVFAPIDISLERIEAVLAGHHLVALRLKRGNHLVETRPVGPDAVDEHDARFGLLGHCLLLFGQCVALTFRVPGLSTFVCTSVDGQSWPHSPCP